MVRSEKVISRKHCIQLMAHPNCHFITDKGDATLNPAPLLVKMYSPSYGAALLRVYLVPSDTEDGAMVEICRGKLGFEDRFPEFVDIFC
jgi:hypothetical protein